MKAVRLRYGQINTSMNYLYKITNLINNKIYIGVHKTDNLDDGYMGSGKIINSAIKKYGLENFKKEILEFFDTYNEALGKEKEIVTDDFLLREDVYNLRRGGTGGFDYINKNIVVDRSSISKSLWKDEEYLAKQKLVDRSNFVKSGLNTFTGKTHTDESKGKISKSRKSKGCGKDNSQFGKIWITNGTISKKINKEDSIPVGWNRGRS